MCRTVLKVLLFKYRIQKKKKSEQKLCFQHTAPHWSHIEFGKLKDSDHLNVRSRHIPTTSSKLHNKKHTEKHSWTCETTWCPLVCCTSSVMATGWLGFWTGDWCHLESNWFWKQKFGLKFKSSRTRSPRNCSSNTHSCSWSSRTMVSSSFFSCWLWSCSSPIRAFSLLFSVSVFSSWDSRRRTSSSR